MRNILPLKIPLAILLLLSVLTVYGGGGQDTLRKEQGYIYYEPLPGKWLYLRDEPSHKTLVTDSVCRHDNMGHKELRYLEDYNSDWCVVRLKSSNVISDSDGMVDVVYTFSTKYVDRRSLEDNAYITYSVGVDTPIKIYSQPNEKSQDVNVHDEALFLLYVTGGTSGDWVKVLVRSTSRYKSGIYLDCYRDIRYVKGSEFRQYCKVWVDDYYEVDPDAFSAQSLYLSWDRYQVKYRKLFGDPLGARDWFPIYVLILLPLIFVSSLLFGHRRRTDSFVRFFLLLIISLLELSYIVLFGYDFWFCMPSKVGWLSAIFFTILSLAVVYLQLRLFFGWVYAVQSNAKNFNTSIGILLFSAITIVMFIYAIFTGGLNTSDNVNLIYVLLAIQLLQVLISAIQLRRHPLYALMVIVLLPLATFAILLFALSIFKFCVLLAIIGLVIYSMANGEGEGSSSEGSAESGASAHVDVAKNCQYFRESGFRCEFQMGECSMCSTGRCKYGQM